MAGDLGDVQETERTAKQSQALLDATTATGLATGGIVGLLGLHSITLAALYAGIEPHPPAAVAPFIGATIAAGLFALPLLRGGNRSGYAAALLFAALSIVSFGPHKLFLANGVEIFPAVLAGFILACTICTGSVAALRAR